MLEDGSDLSAHRLGLVQGGAVLQLIDACEIALVFIGNEGGGDGSEGQCGDHDAAAQSHHHPAPSADQGLDQVGIGALQAAELVVEHPEDQGQIGAGHTSHHDAEQVGPAAEGRGAEASEGQAHDHTGYRPPPAFGCWCFAALEDQAREHRREGECIEGGDGDREGDRQRELLVDDADAAGVEGHRHKHGHQHQRRGHQCAEQFTHAGQGRLPGLHARFDVLRHGLDHHDGVVHHQSRGQHQPQQGELIDRKAEHLDEGEGAHQ